MGRLRFAFNEEKMVQALAFFSLRGIQDLTKLKAAKLLYHADKLHMNRYGRPITGDNYACMEHGPVPSISLNEMNDALDPHPELREEEPALLRVLTADRSFYPGFHIKDGALFDPDVFSQSELDVLEEVAATKGQMSAWELRHESHLEPAWIKANEHRLPGSSTPIAFEQLFDQDNREMLALALEDQCDDDELDNAIFLKAAS